MICLQYYPSAVHRHISRCARPWSQVTRKERRGLVGRYVSEVVADFLEVLWKTTTCFFFLFGLVFLSIWTCFFLFYLDLFFYLIKKYSKFQNDANLFQQGLASNIEGALD